MSKQDDYNEIAKIVESGNGCIILDIAACCCSQYNERSKLSFKIDGEELSDYVVNKKMPNKSYLTISQKYGRKINKFGYLVPVEISEGKQHLSLDIDFVNDVPKFGESKEIHGAFQLEAELTKEKPVAYVRVILNFFVDFEVTPMHHDESDSHSWNEERWFYPEVEGYYTLPKPNVIDGVTVFEEPIALVADTMGDHILHYVLNY